MSSNDHKKFKTGDVSKQANVDVTSETITVPSDSSDYILTVTAPSSTANINGQVDVELEMSPDGENWCPALNREATTETTVAPAAEGQGNEEGVVLIPTENQQKSKFALGSLSYDDNGAETVVDNGTRDALHQHMQVDKPFNFSWWHKTTADNPPSDTHTPVLWRHGGKDTYTNEKVVELTDNVTQNLVESKSTFTTQTNLLNPPYTGAGGIIALANTPAATFYGSSGQVDNGNENDIGKHLMGIWNPHEDFSTSRWMFQNTTQVAGFRHRSSNVFFGYPDINYKTTTYIRFYGGIEFSPFITYSATDAAAKILPVRAVITGQSGGYWYVYTSNPVLEFTRRSDNTTFTVNPFTGYHVAITYTAPADITQGIPESNIAMYVNGQRVKILTTTENNVDYAYGAAPADALFNGDEGFAVNSNWGGAQYLDYGTNYSYNTVINNHMDFQGRVLSESDILKLYNDGKLLDFSNMQTSFPISISNCVGAYDADVPYVLSGTSFIQGLEDCSGYGKRIQLAPSSTSGATTSLISPTLSYNATPENLLAGKFTTGSNLSISGWFKTTDTGILFSNSSNGTDGLLFDIQTSVYQLKFGSVSTLQASSSGLRDGQWHNLVITKAARDGNGLTEVKIYVDGALSTTGSIGNTLADSDLKGSNGFTLLGDGQNNAHASSPSSTDASKLNASLSNWSIHSEVLSADAVSYIYNRGKVRNLKTIPDSSSGGVLNQLAIEAYWKLSDTTSPEEDSIGSKDLQYQDGNSPVETLLDNQIDATGDMLHKEIDQYGSGLTVSLTKRFNFTSNTWGSTSDQDTALCLSFNGFEDHAEYFVLYKCSQGTGEDILDICNNDWNNIIISFSGNQGGTTTDMVEGQNAVFSASNYNFTISYNGQNLASFASAADFVGGLGLNASNATKSFPLYNRHLKFVGTQDEIYQPHCQFNSNIFLPVDYTTNINIPQDVDSITSFQGYVDESSFHSESWWVNAAGVDQTTFSQEKPGTIYGSTTALNNRGVNSTVYGTGKPYPLLNPDVIEASRGTSQWINPYPIGATQEDGNVSTGGIEGFWRWGDIAGDCSENINDAIGDQEDPKDRHRSLKARNFEATEVVGATQDIINLTTSDSIYISESAVVSAIFEYNPVKIETIVSSVCNIKNVVSPILQYLRVKFKGSGTCDLGDGKVKASIHFRKRRKR